MIRIFALGVFLFVFSTLHAADYQRLENSCDACVKIDKLLAKHSQELSPSARADLALKVAAVIKDIHLKGKELGDQRRAIYFAVNGSVEVLRDDFDSETVVRLIDLRAQAPAVFDYVLWRFPLVTQKRIVERMQAAKTDKIRPKAKIPIAKEVDPS
jgi:hypothetical protein